MADDSKSPEGSDSGFDALMHENRRFEPSDEFRRGAIVT